MTTYIPSNIAFCIYPVGSSLNNRREHCSIPFVCACLCVISMCLCVKSCDDTLGYGSFAWEMGFCVIKRIWGQ